MCPPRRRRGRQLSVSRRAWTMPCAVTAPRACGPRKAQGSRVYSYLGMWPGNSLGAGRPALTPNVGSRKGWLDRPRAVGPAFADWARKHSRARSIPGMRRVPSRATSRRWALTTGGEIPGGAAPAAPEKGAGLWLTVSLSGKAPLPDRRRAPERPRANSGRARAGAFC
jgi:hypothetical protein